EAGQKLTPEQKEAQEDWADKKKELKPSDVEINKEIAAHRAGYWALVERRLKEATGSRLSRLHASDFFDAAGMMLLGMAMVKLGIFTASRSKRCYLTMAILGYAVGIPLNTYVAVRLIAGGFDPVNTFLIRNAPYDAGRLAVALGHIGLIMYLFKVAWAPQLTRRLAFVGRMALSNYLLQSVICTWIFDGYGFGLFA